MLVDVELVEGVLPAAEPFAGRHVPEVLAIDFQHELRAFVVHKKWDATVNLIS